MDRVINPFAVAKSPIRSFRLLGMLLILIILPSLLNAQSRLARRVQSLRPASTVESPLLDDRANASAERLSICPGDEIWVVSSRNVECDVTDPHQLEYSQLIDGVFRSRSFGEFELSHSSTPDVATVFYTHGNMTDLKFSLIRGLSVYETVYQNRPKDSMRMRYVIWTWPSERVTYPIGRDAQIKSRRAVAEGKKLRTLLDQMGGNTPSLVGYSYGGQIVLSALQSSTGMRPDRKYKVALIAPGLDRDFVHQELDREAIANSTEKMVAFLNSKDKVIWANNKNLCRRKYRGSGLCDFRISSKLGCTDYLQEIDLTSVSTKKHSIGLYSQMPQVISGLISQLETTSHPMLGEPMLGEPMLGEPMLGEPILGEPILGEPILGEPILGEPILVKPIYATESVPLSILDLPTALPAE